MAHAIKYFLHGFVWILTHRCHPKEFLLKFVKVGAKHCRRRYKVDDKQIQLRYHFYIMGAKRSFTSEYHSRKFRLLLFGFT